MKKNRMSPLARAYYERTYLWPQRYRIIEFIENSNNFLRLLLEYAGEIYEAEKDGEAQGEKAKEQFLNDIRTALKSRHSRGMKRLFLESETTFRDFLLVILCKMGFSDREIAQTILPLFDEKKIKQVKHHNTVRSIILRAERKLFPRCH